MTLLKFTGLYSTSLVRQHPFKVFVFGDNLMRYGKGGQAVIRDVPNTLGVATKAEPTMARDAFFYEQWLEKHLRHVIDDLVKVGRAAETSDVVIPFTKGGHSVSLGLGLAKLDMHSPTTVKVISAYLNNLAIDYGGWGTL